MLRLSLTFALAAWLSAPSAMATTYLRPTWNGYAMDWCKTFDVNCGKPAADLFCQLHGYPQASGFVGDPRVNFQTMTIGQNSICDPRTSSCDSFAEIECQDIAVTTLLYPRYFGFRVDWCREPEANCGAPAALLYCQKAGYSGMDSYLIQPQVLAPTLTMGTNTFCDPRSRECASFAFIRCRK